MFFIDPYYKYCYFGWIKLRKSLNYILNMLTSTKPKQTPFDIEWLWRLLNFLPNNPPFKIIHQTPFFNKILKEKAFSSKNKLLKGHYQSINGDIKHATPYSNLSNLLSNLLLAISIRKENSVKRILKAHFKFGILIKIFTSYLLPLKKSIIASLNSVLCLYLNSFIF